MGTLLDQLLGKHLGHNYTPLMKIRHVHVEIAITDNLGGVAKGRLDAFGFADIGALAEALPTNEILTRFAALDYLNGADPVTLHNNVQEGIERAKSWLAHNHRGQAK